MRRPAQGLATFQGAIDFVLTILVVLLCGPCLFGLAFRGDPSGDGPRNRGVKAQHETAAVVILNYAPYAAESVARTHCVDEGYLRAHRTPNAFRVFETDVADWLTLRGPGILYDIVPYKTLVPQLELACQPAEGNVAAHYLVPLEGGRFEAAYPLEDLYAPGMPPSGNNGSVRCAPDRGRGRPLGQAYSESTAVFGSDSHLNRASFFRDEAYDHLSSGLWPHRIAHREGRSPGERQRDFRDFSVAVLRSYMVSEEFESDGRRTLFHIVQPGRSKETTGSRDTVYGTRIVPPARDWDDIIAWEHEKAHSGNRATQKIIHGMYYMNTAVVLEKLQAFKRGCDMCSRNLKLPKSLPAEHIVSEHFGERILVDCKEVRKRGHIVVAVDHFTTYTWTMFVKRKFAQPIANFMHTVMESVDRIRRDRPRMDRASGEPLATALHAADSKDLRALIKKETDMELATVKILQSDNGSELKNKMMTLAMTKMQVLIRNSRPYNPRTNGKAENRVKSVGKMVFTELDAAGGVLGSSTSKLEACLRSATAILNHRPGTVSLFSPFQAAHHWKPSLRTSNGLSNIVKGEALHPDEIRHMISKIRTQQAGKALYDKAKHAAPMELPSVVKLQVGSLVAFYDPAPKLKTRRLTGVIDRLTHGGTQAKVKVSDSKQTLTINCSLLSHRGDLDESTRSALHAWRRFKKMQVMARNGSPSETSDDDSRSSDPCESEGSEASDDSGRFGESEDNERSESDDNDSPSEKGDDDTRPLNSDGSEPSGTSEDSGRSQGSEDNWQSRAGPFDNNEGIFRGDDLLSCDGAEERSYNTEPNRTESGPGESNSMGPLLPNSDVDETCQPVYLDRWAGNSCHFNCMLPVFIAVDEVMPLPIGPEVTQKSSQYFGVVAAVGKGMHQKLESRLKARLRKAREELLGEWPRGLQFPGVTPFLGDPVNVLEAVVRGEREDGKGLQSSEVVEASLAAAGLAHSWTVSGCSAHPNAHVSSSLGARFYRPCALRLAKPQGTRAGVQEIVDSMKMEVGELAWYRERRKCPHCIVEKGEEKAQMCLYKLRLNSGRPSLFFAQAGRTGDRKIDGSFAPSFSVNVFGDTYSLLAIVYSIMGALHYTVQTYLPTEKCWIIYDDRRDSEADHAHYFDPDYKAGEEYLFLYMRTDILAKKGCHHGPLVVGSDVDASGTGGIGVHSHSSNGSAVSSAPSCGSPSGFKRKFGIGEGDGGAGTGGSGSDSNTTKAARAMQASSSLPSAGDRKPPGSQAKPACSTALGYLTEGQQVEVDGIFSAGGTSNIVVDIALVGFRRERREPVSLGSFQTLMPDRWLSDNIVNPYFALLAARDIQMCHEDNTRRPSLFLNSFFITAVLGSHGEKNNLEDVERWPRNWKVKPLQAKRIYIPHNDKAMHWRLFVIDVEEQKIRCFDSLNYASSSVLDMLAEWASDEYFFDTAATMVDPDKWEKEKTPDAVAGIQENGVDCGIFMCAFANMLSADMGVEDVTQAEIPKLRRKMASQILEKRVASP